MQTSFSAAGLQRYRTVDYSEPLDVEASGDDSMLEDHYVIAAVLEEWDRAAEKHKQTLEIVDTKVAKTDHTLWFKRTGWPEHLAGCNMRHLSRATRMPDRDETMLRRTVELIDVLIERAVGGPSTLDHETRPWLRSAKQAEIDV